MTASATKLCLGALLLITSLHVFGEIYKVTDEDGNTRYTNIEPKTKGKEATRVDLKNINISEEGKHLPGSDDTIFEELREEREAKEAAQREKQNEKQAAYEALQQAKRNLEEAKEVKAGDFFNTRNGGLRYKDSYHRRVEEAERALEAARERYEEAQ